MTRDSIVNDCDDQVCWMVCLGEPWYRVQHFIISRQ